MRKRHDAHTLLYLSDAAFASFREIDVIRPKGEPFKHFSEFYQRHVVEVYLA